MNPFPIFLKFQTILHKNYETTHVKVRFPLPSPLQSNVARDRVEIV